MAGRSEGDADVSSKFRLGGVGARVILMTYSSPARDTAVMGDPLKKSRNIDLTCMYRGCVSNSSDPKWMTGRIPG